VVPPCSDRISRVPPYSRINRFLRIRGCHPLWPAFPDRSACSRPTTGLFRFRSPLLAESLLMSFPPGTEMFQFPGFASPHYGFMWRYPKGVGCPIRTSTDQRLLAAPRGFSQRATSFIASWCQGIHRMPLSRSRSKSRPILSDQTTQPTIHSMQPSELPPAIGTAGSRSAPQAAMTGHSLSTKHIASEHICPVARLTPPLLREIGISGSDRPQPKRAQRRTRT
jgi:hypothetical protein